MKQKFRRGDCVKVSNNMPKYMSHFEKGFIGIIEGSYEQLCGDGNLDKSGCDYCIIQLNSKGRAVDTIAWYPEAILKKSKKFTKKEGKKIIDKYLFDEG